MKRLVIDASVAAKWYFNEEHSEKAALLLSDEYVRLAPDLIYVEVAAVAWKRARRGEIDPTHAKDALTELRRVDFEATPNTELIATALQLALQTERSVYDCLYLALAIASAAPLLTADQKLFAGLRTGPFSRHLQWLGDLA
jgi:predicted nucleic acid-binding protein